MWISEIESFAYKWHYQIMVAEKTSESANLVKREKSGWLANSCQTSVFQIRDGHQNLATPTFFIPFTAARTQWCIMFTSPSSNISWWSTLGQSGIFQSPGYEIGLKRRQSRWFLTHKQKKDFENFQAYIWVEKGSRNGKKWCQQWLNSGQNMVE